MTLPEFITRDPQGYLHLTGHRIGLKDLVVLYNEGYPAEMLACAFPTVSLALVHKVLGFYLENKGEFDVYVAAEESAIERSRVVNPQGPTLQELRRRLSTRAAS